MSDDIKVLREVLAKFDEMEIEQEVIIENLDKTLKNYQAIQDDTNKSTNNLIAVSKATDTLIKNISLLLSDMEKLKSQLPEESNKMIKTVGANYQKLHQAINSEIATIENKIRIAFSSAANIEVRINETHLENVINKKIEGIDLTKFNDLTKNINDVYSTSNELLNRTQVLEDHISKKLTELDNELNKVNNRFRPTQFNTLFFVFFIGLAVGLFAMQNI